MARYKLNRFGDRISSEVKKLGPKIVTGSTLKWQRKTCSTRKQSDCKKNDFDLTKENESI